MIGDKLVITDYHRAAAAQALDAVRRRLEERPGPESSEPATVNRSSTIPLAVSIAGLTQECAEGSVCVVCSDR